MKKAFIYAALSLTLCLSLASSVSADVVIVPYVVKPLHNPHPVEYCARISNLNEFPNILLTYYASGSSGIHIKPISSGGCLPAFDRFDMIGIYDATEPKKADLGEQLYAEIPVGSRDVDESNHLIKEEKVFTLAKTSEGKVMLYKSKQTSEYNDGTPPKIETFSQPQDNQRRDIEVIPPTPATKNGDSINTPPPKPPDESGLISINGPPHPPAKTGFWHAIACFFMSLFGKSCR
jgi:hypothetical protein